jgi:hypothetical protein
MKKRRKKVSKYSYISYYLKKYSLVLRFKKWRRNKRLKTKTSKLNKDHNFFSVAKLLKTRILFLIIFLSILILLFYIHIRLLTNIKPTVFEGQRLNSSFSAPDYNVVFLWLDEENNKYFVDGIVVVSINSSDNTRKIIGVNTDFILGYIPLRQKFTFRTLLNQIKTENNLVSFINEIEDFTGIRLDKYLVFTKTGTLALISSGLLDVEIDDDAQYKINNEVLTNKIALTDEQKLNLIFSLSEGTFRNKIITSTVENFLNKNRSLLDMYFLFWKFPDVTSNIFTDMTKNEFFTFFDLLRGKRNAQPLLLGDNVGIPSNTGLEDGIEKNYIALDESVREYLQSLSVMTEQASVEIYNATQTPGIANELSRNISVYGVNVVKVGNFSEDRFYTQVILFSDKNNVFPNTIPIIKKAIKLKDFRFEIRSPKDSGNFTGDIVIILGQDYVDLL